MRDRKELIYLNVKDITPEELEKLGDYELNCCDVCGEIDSTYRLNWIEGEDFWDDKRAVELVKKGNCAVCDGCLEK
jgi:hypothetical protein